MCGLAGLWSHQASASEATAVRMAAALSHRGPDYAGCWSDPHLGVALAHRRLAILDLSPAGHQPMHSASGRYVLAFNGEIYNHLQLRAELERTGLQRSPWRGHSDTETLLAAIETWGLEAALQRCRGMLALALVDREAQLLHLARDRFGEKPLYYGLHGGTFRFGSELCAFTADPSFPRELDRRAVDQLLRLSYIPAPHSIYAGVFKLPPGHRLSIPLSQASLQELPAPQPWWRLHHALATGLDEPFEEPPVALVALEQSLQDAIAEQSLADVPVGCFLSGGIDSSLIAALMQRQSSRPVRTFTIGFEDGGLDESPHAAAVAQHLGSEHTTAICTSADALAIVPQLASIHAEPFADASQIPTQLLCRAVRQSELKVCLSGDGGDELFGGYSRYGQLARQWQQLGSLPPAARQLLGRTTRLADSVIARLGASSAQRRLSRVAAQLGGLPGDLVGFHAAHTSWWGPSTKLVKGSTAARPARPSCCQQAAQQLSDIRADPRSLLMALEATGYLPDDLLVKMDRAAMAVSLETRAPYLDPAVASVALRCSAALHFRDGHGKWLLRTLLDRQVPSTLTHRPKAGFTPPLGAWLRGPLQAWAEDLLAPERLQAQGLLYPDPIAACWRSHQQGRSDQSTRLWPVLILQSWLNHWLPS